jgi:hypothetical protein
MGRGGVAVRVVASLAALLLLVQVVAPASAQEGKPNALSEEQVKRLCQEIVGFVETGDYANATKALKDANPDKDSLKSVVKCIIKELTDRAKSKIDIVLMFYKWGQKMGPGASGKFFGAVGGVLADLLGLAVGELVRILQTPAETNGFLSVCVKTMQNLGFNLEEATDLCTQMASGS